MSGSWQLPESHLLPDAIVAFVDGELEAGARERAATHIMRCAACAADVTAQRQAREAVHDSQVPAMPAGLLASLSSIPQTTDISSGPDNLAVTADGQLVAVQRPDRPQQGSTFGSTRLGSSTPLGANALGRKSSKRTAQGAGVVVSGLVLTALAFALTVEEGGVPTRTGTESGVMPARYTEGTGTTSNTAVPTTTSAVTASTSLVR
ncbi:zf-HC2 domain-containing protein [Haloechinothrix salitolerans]|uniref:Anti-sigma factor family protein n=1 Tax=Haloechinothrix salitolerans TaxID=926830 RepID=A0ABW2CAI7_9PSEU